jgi:hypothetical protein
MAKSVLELAVGTGQWDAGLKKAKSALDNFTQANGGLQQALDKESQKMQQFVRMMGGMESTAKTAKGQMNDYKSTIEQLTMQYNRMSEAQKKVVGQDYLQAIEQMKQKYQSVNKEIQDMNRSLKNVEMPEMKGGGMFSGIGSKMEGALAVFGGNLMTKAAGAVASLGSEMADMVKQGVEMAKAGEGIRIAFERLGRGDILQGLREATHGTVTDLELMKAAVKFNDFKLPLDELGTMLAFAQQKAKDTGQSVDYMVDSIVTGLGRKSLMILDNLGLSATEVKDKMKETGDMTKAVGAIIREQMAKAGDYVETAADRAAQANVSLQNKMEELGRKFAPVEEASNQLWTSMKIGILDIIGGPLATLLNQLTEAGRLKNMLNNLNGEAGSGNTKVDNQLKKLNVIKKAGGSDYIFNSTLSGMVEDYNRQIMALDTQIKNGGKRPGAGSGESQDVRYLQQKMDALKIMRDQLAAGAKEINKPIKIESNIPDVTGGGKGKGGRSGGGKSSPSYAPDSITAQQQLVSDLSKKWNDAGAEVRDEYLSQLIEAEKKLKEMNDAEGMKRERMQGRLLLKPEDIIMPDTSNLNLALNDTLDKIRDYAKNNPVIIPITTVNDDIKKLTKTARMTADVVGSIGDAFNAIEDPAAKVAGTVAQAIATVAAGYATATLAAAETGNPWVWVAFAASGLAQMLTMVSTIHSATGYAEGGIVKGNHYSGDMLDGGSFGINAGELVLNRAQQGSLASQLEGSAGGFRNGQIVGRIEGEKIVLVANRYFRRTGQGEILTWK